jgi:hypothetical protein
MMQSGAGACRAREARSTRWHGSCLPQGHEQSQDKADCTYTNIELPQADLSSQSLSQSHVSLLSFTQSANTQKRRLPLSNPIINHECMRRSNVYWKDMNM